MATSRDAYVYNSSSARTLANGRAMVRNYSDALSVREQHPTYEIDRLASEHSSNLRWDRELKNNLRRGKRIRFSRNRAWLTQYRPFTKQHSYVDYVLVNNKYQMDSVFPTADSDNQAICVPGIGSTNPFSTLIVDAMPDLHLMSFGQCFPRYRFEQVDGDDMLSRRKGEVVRVDNITDAALRSFRDRCDGARVTKDAIFYYVYGVLHAPAYRERFANDLLKELPRIPLPANRSGFRAFTDAGRKLARLHLRYDEATPWPLTFAKGGWRPGTPMDAESWFRVERMRQPRGDRSVVRYNDHIEIRDIPESAWTYHVNGKPAIAWVLDRQTVKTDRSSGIVNDANDYAIETATDPSYPLRLLARVIRVSVDTVEIVKSLPNPDLP